MRYDAVGAGPLWSSSNGVPEEADVPPCSRCGRARKFEFQVRMTEFYSLALILGVLAIIVLCGVACAGYHSRCSLPSWRRPLEISSLDKSAKGRPTRRNVCCSLVSLLPLTLYKLPSYARNNHRSLPLTNVTPLPRSCRTSSTFWV